MAKQQFEKETETTEVSIGRESYRFCLHAVELLWDGSRYEILFLYLICSRQYLRYHGRNLYSFLEYNVEYFGNIVLDK